MPGIAIALMRLLPGVLLAVLLCTGTGTALATPVRIAIIIDDIGYHRSRGLEAINLHPGITCAVIPRTPHGPRLAREAARQGREVIIHLPMAGNGLALDPGGIHSDMTPEDIAAVVREAFALIPEATGLNNHMGSVTTSDPEAMHWLMHELASHQAFFVDSRTSPASVAELTALAHGLPATGRDIFLDNERDLMAINDQFNALLRLARRRGSAIAIGHPYPETLEYLRRALPLLKEAGIELVPVSMLLPELQSELQSEPLPELQQSELSPDLLPEQQQSAP